MSNSNQEEKPLSLQQIREALREDIRAELKTGSTVKGENILDQVKADNKVHTVRSFEKWCPDCGLRNPNYVKPKRKCSKCEQPASATAKVCWNCGSKHLDTEDEEEEEDEEDGEEEE